jgi:alpha-L-fucosidase
LQQILHDASEIPSAQRRHPQVASVSQDTLTLELPVRKPDVAVPVIELFLK